MGPHGETQPRKDTQGQANVHTPQGHIAAQRDPETRLRKTPWPNKHGRAKYGATHTWPWWTRTWANMAKGGNSRRWVWPGAEVAAGGCGQGQMCTCERGNISRCARGHVETDAFGHKSRQPGMETHSHNTQRHTDMPTALFRPR